MHIFEFAFYSAGAMYALLYEQRLLVLFLIVLGLYCLISFLYPGAANVRARRKIMFATWAEPAQGIIHNRMEIRVGHAIDYLEKQFPDKHGRPTLTHLAIKAVSECARVCPDINGKIAFGRFVPYKTIDVNCLVDVDGGNDLAMVLVEGVDKMSLEDVGDYIRSKTSGIRSSKGGDAMHKKRTGPAKFLPTFMLSILLKLMTFLTSTCGIDMKMVGMKKDAFGVAMVTSVGMLGFTDASAPFTPFANCPVLVAVNKVIEKPMVVDHEIKIERVLIVNFTVDHRYLDGGKAAKMPGAFEHVFIEPEKFVRGTFKPEEIAEK